jgi:pyrroline-5-carboxylate reductase
MSTNNNESDLQPIRAGFIGCGTIAYSIASGLANPSHSTYLSQNSLALSSIHVTRRSESRSSQLKEAYPDVVTVCETAEEVVKNSEIVFLCVLPQHVDEVLAELKEKGVWKEGVHTLVSLVVCANAVIGSLMQFKTSHFIIIYCDIIKQSTSKVDDLIQKTSLPKESVYKMICLPPIANREGCALLQPPAPEHPYLKSMLDALGGCVECANDDTMNAMMIPGCLMGPMYGIMRNNRDWLGEI